MSELTDDQLDGLFRKSAEEFDPPFDPAAWQDMKSRLDEYDGTVPGKTPLWKNILRWGAAVSLLLLLMFGSYYTYDSVTNGRDSSSVVAVVLPPMNTSAPLAGTMPPTQQRSVKSKVSEVGSEQRQSPGVSGPSVEKDDQPAAPETLKTPTASGEANATKEENPAYEVNSRRVGANREETTRNRTMPAERIPATAVDTKRRKQRTGKPVIESVFIGKRPKSGRIDNNASTIVANSNYPKITLGASLETKRSSERNRTLVSVGVASTSESINQPNGVQAEAAGLSVINELAIRPANWPKALPFTGRDLVVASPPPLAEPSVVPKPPVTHEFSVRFAVAPDLSSVGLKNFSRPGTNVGLLLEYRLASRWSVQAGLIQSTKIYQAKGSEYTAPPGSYVDMVKAKLGSVDGRCNMFDIPINLRYDVLLRPRETGLSPTRWFISGGVTSYYIKQEDYVYNYTGYVHNAVSEWSTKTGGYGFSQLNLSVGYERALTKRLSWQIEPFMKMPLKGVGFFKIDLLSTGTFFSIRYKL
ncbi:porin family protein [Spirosoma pulveris]